MNTNHVQKQLTELSLSLFRKDFFGIYHGSLSAKTDSGRFLINKSDAVFDSLSDDNLTELHFKKDYRWKNASMDADIHLGIYSNISDAKFITFTMPPFTTAYTLDHKIIIPKDYFGDQEIGKIEVYDPKQFDDWYDRAATVIPKYFIQHHSNLMIIKGYGVYSYNRDIHQMAKKLAILEKSCRLLTLNDASSSKLDGDF